MEELVKKWKEYKDYIDEQHLKDIEEWENLGGYIVSPMPQRMRSSFEGFMDWLSK